MSEDASISVGANASAAERVAAVMKTTWRDLGDSIKSSIGGAARAVLADLASIATAQGKVNFTSQHQQVREFEGATARMATAMRRDLEGVRASVESTGHAIGKRPGEVAQWADSVGQLTYDLGGAADAMKGMSGLAADTGRGVESYRGLAVTLSTVGHVAGDTTHAVGVLQAQADMLGTKGGVAAFADQIDALRDTVSNFAVSSEADFSKITALAAELGKGLSPQAAGRVQQSAFGAVAADPLKWERYLGHGIMNKEGHVEDPSKVLQEITEKTRRRYGKDARRVLQLNFGAETGAAMDNADYKEAAKAAGLGPSDKPAAAQSTLNNTDAGKRNIAEADADISARKMSGSATALGTAADKLQKFAASYPILSTALTTGVTMGMGTLASTLGSHIATMMGGKGAGGAVGGAVDLATKGIGGVGAAIPVIGAGLAGVGVGMAAGELIMGSDENIYNDAVHNKTGEDKKNDSRTASLKSVRDRVRAAKGAAALPGGVTVSEEDTQLARNAASGSQEAVAALASKIHSEGASEKDAQIIARAVAEAVKSGMKGVQIVNASGGPVNMSENGAQSSSAGSQGT